MWAQGRASGAAFATTHFEVVKHRQRILHATIQLDFARLDVGMKVPGSSMQGDACVC